MRSVSYEISLTKPFLGGLSRGEEFHNENKANRSDKADMT